MDKGSSFVIPPQWQLQELITRNGKSIIHSFSRKVEQRHVAKMFGSSPSILDGDMLTSRFGI